VATTDTLLNRVFDGRYVIRRRLGSGGMADVYLAEDQELGRQVALKMLNERHAADEQFVERFRREAQNAAGLNHPNIVSIFDRGRAEGTYYIAMEYLDGRTLKELLVKNGPTPIPISIDYSRQILNALSFAHRHGIVHRDIKPHNVVVGADGRVKVTDFGIARSEASQMTEVGSIVGTAQYLSPEQARGAPVDARSDIYSLGIVLYEMLTGKVPFVGEAPLDIAMKHLQAVPDPPSKHRPEVPRDLDAVVMRALAKDPEDRYASADEMEGDLARVSRGVAVLPKTEEAMTQVISRRTAPVPVVVPPPQVLDPLTPPPGPPYYGYEPPRRRRSWWPWILLLAILIGAAAGYLLYERVQRQLNENKPIGVVDVTRVKEALAKAKLEQEGFVVVVQTGPNSTVPAGSVSQQDPVGGGKATPGSTVTITVSTGAPRTVVPAVKGYTLNQALSILSDAQLKPDAHDVFSSTAQGTVTAQLPKPGKTVLVGSKVRINISQGLKPVSVPSVVGEPSSSAEGALRSAGFVVVPQSVDSDKAVGLVVAQEPLPGASVPVGTTITISVSKGPQVAQVPDVSGQAQADAEALLRTAGYTFSVVQQDVTDPASDGIVLSQQPQGGKTVKKGTLVTLYVGHLTAPPPADTTTTTTTTPTTPTLPAATTTPVAGLPGTTGSDATNPPGEAATTTTTTTAVTTPTGPPPP
jgi:eukaryotic-like serine/threonine-protein kinase